VGPLRAKIIAHAGGYVQDVVIAGHDRELVAGLVFPNVPLCRAACPDLPVDTPVRRMIDDPRVVEVFRRLLTELAAQGTGSSTFLARALLVDVPPSIDAREMTDKGSLNQKAVLENRGQSVDELYGSPPSSRVIVV